MIENDGHDVGLVRLMTGHAYAGEERYCRTASSMMEAIVYLAIFEAISNVL